MKLFLLCVILLLVHQVSNSISSVEKCIKFDSVKVRPLILWGRVISSGLVRKLAHNTYLIHYKKHFFTPEYAKTLPFWKMKVGG